LIENDDTLCFLLRANSFAEYAPEPNPETKKEDVWFALTDDRPSPLSLAYGPPPMATVAPNRSR
jgi:hypothetical protein